MQQSKTEDMISFPWSIRSLHPLLLLLLLSISLLLISGSSSDPSTPKVAKNAVGHEESSSSSIGLKVVLVCLGVLATVAFTVFLFKLWQKKKREEQHAQLLKLFEDDDELEVELGIRD